MLPLVSSKNKSIFRGLAISGPLENGEIDFSEYDFINFVYNTTFLLLNHIVLRNRGCLQKQDLKKIIFGKLENYFT